MKVYIKSNSETTMDGYLSDLEISVYYYNDLQYTCSFTDYNQKAFNECVTTVVGFSNDVADLCAYYDFLDKYEESPITAFMMSIYEAYCSLEFELKVKNLRVVIDYSETEWDKQVRENHEKELAEIFKRGYWVKVTYLSAGMLVRDTDTDKVFIIGDIKRDKMNYDFYDNKGKYINTYSSDDQLLTLPDEYSSFFGLK